MQQVHLSGIDVAPLLSFGFVVARRYRRPRDSGEPVAQPGDCCIQAAYDVMTMTSADDVVHSLDDGACLVH